MEQIFWKSTKQHKNFSQQLGNITADPPVGIGLHSELHTLKNEDQEIGLSEKESLIELSKQEQLNNHIMGAAQLVSN